MTELDTISTEKKASYEQIKSYVLEHTGLKVSHLNIAQIKRKHGIIERDCYNLPKSENSREPNCTVEKAILNSWEELLYDREKTICIYIF